MPTMTSESTVWYPPLAKLSEVICALCGDEIDVDTKYCPRCKEVGDYEEGA
jgi:predicted amidophosphoribosyltransferase